MTILQLVMMKLTYIFTVFIALSFPLVENVSAQINITQGMTPTQYVNDVLLGEGLQLPMFS